ncbi:MAG: hypothetical protein LIO93_02590, partial [Bacteroidales bacterium]|nr:hypothetical protein [Bacteroidales bacterium]
MTELYKGCSIPQLSAKDNLIEIILVTSGYLILDGNFSLIRINSQELHLAVSQNSAHITEYSDDLKGWYCRFNSTFVNYNTLKEDLFNEIEVLSSFLYQYPLRLTIRAYERLSFHFHSIHQLCQDTRPDYLLINTYLLDETVLSDGSLK